MYCCFQTYLMVFCEILAWGFKVSIFQINWFWVQSWELENKAFFVCALDYYDVLEWFCWLIVRERHWLILGIDFLVVKILLGGSCWLFPRAGSFIVIFSMSNDSSCSRLSVLLLHRDCWTGTNKYYWVYKYNRKKGDLKVCLGQKFREMK